MKSDPDFELGIYKVFKQIHPELSLSIRVMSILSSMVYDLLKKICYEAENLLKINDKITLKFRQIQTSVALILNGDLIKHANMEGNKRVKQYIDSYSKQEKIEKNKASKSDKKEKKKQISKTERSGLLFSVSKVRKCMKNIRCADKISYASSVFLAAVLEYLVAEVIELSGNVAKDGFKQRIVPRHVMLAVRNDNELATLFKKCTFINCGVVPNIHRKLLPSKPTSKKQF